MSKVIQVTMSNTLPYPEVWLLERSVDHHAIRLQLAWLPDTRRSRQSGHSDLWNCPPHGLSGTQLCEVIWNLWHQGELELLVCEDSKEQPLVPASALELHQLLVEEILGRRAKKSSGHVGRIPFRLFYRITAVGIARWEGYAIADWSRFRGDFVGKLYTLGKTTWSQTAMNELFAREVLDVYGSDVFQPATIHWETAQVVHHEPWDVFPGKQFPRGVTVSVDVTEHAQRGFTCDEWEQVRPMDEEHDRRFREICDWYQNGTHNHPERPRPPTDDAGIKEGSA